MPTPPRRLKRRVWFSLGAGLLVVASWVWWQWSSQQAAVPAPAVPSPFVRLAGSQAGAGNRLLQEKAELLDPTPLFFPTEWNYGQRPLDLSRLRQPGQFFASFAPKLDQGAQRLARYGEEVEAAPEKLTDLLVQGNEAPFAGMGQVDRPLGTLPVRGAFLQVRELDNSEAIIEQSLAGINPPRSDYAPVEFLVLVGPGGMIGSPVLVSGSGWVEVDEFFRDYLVKAYHLGGRLSPGRYLVLVGA